MKTIILHLFCVLLFAQSAQSVSAQSDIVLYGLRINLNDDVFAGVDSIDLQSVNPVTGEQNFLFSIDDARSIAAGSSTYNADQNQFFFWGNDASNTQRIYNLDLNTLDVPNSPETADIIVDIEYNYANGKVYGLRLTPGDQSDPLNPELGDLDLVELDLETGATVLVSALPDTQATGQGNSTFDPINNRFIFLSFNQGSASVIGIDVTTGETAFNTNLDSVDGQVLAFEYDWTNERLLGIRQTSMFDLTTDPFSFSMQNFLVEIDVDTGEVNDISSTPAFEDTGVAIGGVAFDQRSGTFISYVSGTTLGMISADTGQVYSTVELPEYLYELQVDNLVFAQSLNLQAAPLLGDINRDGTVGFLDISPFVELLAAGDFQIEADLNQDDEVNFLDVAPFIFIMSSDNS